MCFAIHKKYIIRRYHNDIGTKKKFFCLGNYLVEKTARGDHGQCCFPELGFTCLYDVIEIVGE
jgi:hypothetical protein